MADRGRSLVQTLRLRLRLNQGEMSPFGSERSFDMPIGSHWRPGEPPRGYYIDFANKCESPRWPPYWLGTERAFHVASTQWGLGAFERYVKGEGEEWLAGALGAAEHLLGAQQRGGPQDGGWAHLVPYPHSYHIDPPWLSGLVQGEGASLLIRLYLETGDERYEEAARRALRPMSVSTSEGGVLARLEDGVEIIEEYPTDAPSWVLNGAVFGLWGIHDIAQATGDAEASARFDSLTDGLASNLWRFDTGYWSLYDIYPHPIANLATPAYHGLHIKQLQVLNELAPRPQLAATAQAFAGYREAPRCRRRALAKKVAFRVLVPRNKAFAFRLPWNRGTRSKRRARRSERLKRSGRRSDVLVLSYHAVSPDWPAALSVTPQRLTEQLELLARRGYRAVTFAEAVNGNGSGKVVAITFDDGYRSVVELARPILERFEMPATVFVPTDLIDRDQPMAWPGIDMWLDGPHEQELLPMSWQQARELIEDGWEIGSHTKSHPRLTQIPDGDLEEELAGSRRECERMLGQACESLAFPYGDHDERVVAATGAAGYSAAAALPAHGPESSPLAWPRVGVYYHDSELSFRLKVSPTVRRLRASPIWGPLMRTVRAISDRKGKA